QKTGSFFVDAQARLQARLQAGDDKSGFWNYVQRRWLHNNQEVDVLLLQEIHWSLGRILQVRCEAKQANLDIICAYQWVRRDNTTRDTEQLRGKFWSVLSGLLAGLPRRNMLVLGGDFNSMVAPLPGLIGRGLLPHPTRKPEPEFLTVLEEHKLCLLNTWSKATPAVCATFRNGAIVSQIDFVAVRRRNADALARRAKPTSLDLAPGREGEDPAVTEGIREMWRRHSACPVLYAKRKETTCTVLTGEVPLKNAETMAASADAEMAEVARREYAEVMGALPGLPSLMTATRRKPEEDKDKEEDRQSKYPRPGTEASKGQGQRRGKGNWSRNSWDSANWSRSSGWGDQGEKENKQLSEPDYATQALLRSMTKLVICHEEELARLRVDTSWMLFVDTHEEGIVPLLQQAAEQWQIKCEAREVTTGLRVVLFLALINEAKRRLELMLEPEQQQRATNVGWMGQGSTALAPVWYYHVWNPERMQQERSDRQPLCHQTATATRGLEGEHTSPVVPFMLSLSLRNEATARCHQALAALDGNACLKPSGIRLRPERGQPSQLCRELADHYLKLSYTDWTARPKARAQKKPSPPRTTQETDEL
ncbi:unnamed protein product, partial [Symbiodinium microadriaticum]